MVFKFQHRLAATAMIAALALPALAQTTPAAAPAAPAAGATAPDGRQAKPAGERRDHRERHQAHKAQRLAALKDQLKLTPAQEPAWATYSSAMQPGERSARLDRKDMDKLTTPERIDRMRALRAQHAAEADRRGEATKAFYATLTPEQQKTFDAKTAHQHHRHHRGGAHGSGEGRHHGKGGDRHHHGDAGRAAAPAAPAATAAPAK